MAKLYFLVLLVVFVALSRFDLSKSQIITAKVSCLDCHTNTHIAGIKVVVKCEKGQKLVTATTEDDGSFEAETPSSSPLNCIAKLVGGPKQIYASKQSMVSKITKISNNKYTTLNPLSFYSSSPQFASSKTIDLPLPHEWGLAPSSYYFPFFPIIGIP